MRFYDSFDSDPGFLSAGGSGQHSASGAREHLMAANGIVMQVQALAGLLGPILAGMLYGIGGVKPILAASAVCFFFYRL